MNIPGDMNPLKDRINIDFLLNKQVFWYHDLPSLYEAIWVNLY